MPSPTVHSHSAAYQPALAWFAAVGSAWVFVLVTMGAFTTSIGAGMAFPDWPLSNGSVNPHGWLEDVAMFAEHSHRLTGTVMGLITIGLVIGLVRGETRAWLRRLGWWALAIVVVQGVLGGTRVLLDAVNVPGFTMSLGQMLRIPHGILAQVYVCVLFAIAAGLSRPWIESRDAATHTADSARDAALPRLARWSVLLVFAQLVIAATMRHNHAGLAIATFPFSTPEGALLPAHWDFRVALNFAHRVMACVLAVALVALAVRIWRSTAAGTGLKRLAALMTALLVLQICLGALVIWRGRDPYFTTGHVIVGASTLATTFLIALLLHRGRIEGLRPTPDRAASSSSAASASRLSPT